jgi:hypothetical protein
MAPSELQTRIKKQHQMGLKDDHWDHHAVARYMLEGELGLNGQTAQHVYDLDQEQVNTLLFHARQDAANALGNTFEPKSVAPARIGQFSFVRNGLLLGRNCL